MADEHDADATPTPRSRADTRTLAEIARDYLTEHLIAIPADEQTMIWCYYAAYWRDHYLDAAAVPATDKIAALVRSHEPFNPKDLLRLTIAMLREHEQETPPPSFLDTDMVRGERGTLTWQVMRAIDHKEE